MAWLQIDPSGKFHIGFRFAGRKYKGSLKTKCRDESDARLHRLEENIRLVESGRKQRQGILANPTTGHTTLLLRQFW